MINHHSKEIICVYKEPLWARVFVPSMMTIFIFAVLKKWNEPFLLWSPSLPSRLVIITSCLVAFIFIIEAVRSTAEIAKEWVYVCHWYGCKYVYYKDFPEVFYTVQGKIYLGTKYFSRQEFSVPPSKLAELLDSMALEGCKTIEII